MRFSARKGQRPAGSRLAWASAVIVESIEARVLFSTQVWNFGTGNWDTTAANFAGPSAWTQGNVAQFGGTATGSTITIDDGSGGVTTGTTAANGTLSLSAPGLVFDSNGANDTIAASGSDSLLVKGIVSVPTGISATISAPMTYVNNGNLGSVNGEDVAFDQEGGGTLTLTAQEVLYGNQANSGGSGQTNSFLVGQLSANNTLNLNGATVGVAGFSSTPFTDIGLSTGTGTFGGNIINLTNNASVRDRGNGTQTFVGYDSSNNQLNVKSGSSIYTISTGGTIQMDEGDSAGANGNAITVDGAGSLYLLSASGPMSIGGAGNGNSLTVTNGGNAGLCGKFYVGSGGGTNNYVIVNGTNSILDVTESTGNTTIGIGGSSVSASTSNGNYVSVQAGGTFLINNSSTGRFIAIGAAGSNNYIQVTGSGSLLNVPASSVPITVGGLATGGGPNYTDGAGSGNYLAIGSSGKVSDPKASIYVGGTNGAIDLGDGTGASTLTVGATAGYSNGVFLRNASGLLNINAGDLVSNEAGNLVSGSGQIDLLGTGTDEIDPINGVSDTVTVAITGSGSLTVGNGGKLFVNSASYTGNTTVSGSNTTLDFRAAGPVGISSTSNVNIGSGAFLQLDGGGSTTVGSLIINGVTEPAGTYNPSNSLGYITGSGNIVVSSSLPPWMAQTSNATWDGTTLAVTGPSTMILDPVASDGDDPIIVASGSAAQLTIAPTNGSPVDVHVDGITLTNGARIEMESVSSIAGDSARSHSNHNVLVLGTTAEASDPMFSVDSASKIDMQDNDLIVHTAGDSGGYTMDSTVNGLIDGPTSPGSDNGSGRDGGLWDGHGLTSSYAENQVQNIDGYETVQLGEVDNGDLATAYTTWQVGSAVETLGGGDIIVKYTYTADFNLEGVVSFTDSAIQGLYYSRQAESPPYTSAWAFGDTDGNTTVDFHDASNLGLDYGNGTGSASAEDPTRL